MYILFRLYLEKLKYFYIKNNYYSYSFPMRLVIASGNFLGKPVIIDAFWCIFWLHSEWKSGSFHIEIMISAAQMLGSMLPCEKILKKCAIWCVLANILIRFCIKIVFLKWSLCIELYDIHVYWWAFRAFSLWINMKYRAILCVLVYILIESCI